MRRRATAVLSFLAVAASPLAVLATAPAAEAAPTELFFSEYVEGSSFNKALEVYNGTAAVRRPRRRACYSIQQFSNGAATARATVNLTGTVAQRRRVRAGPVLGRGGARGPGADQTSGAGLFNGDDALVLRKGTTVLDVFGQIGADPGDEWGTGTTSTLRQHPSPQGLGRGGRLRRQPTPSTRASSGTASGRTTSTTSARRRRRRAGARRDQRVQRVDGRHRRGVRRGQGRGGHRPGGVQGPRDRG